MAKKPSPVAEEVGDTSSDANEVAALRAMSREDRLRALMKNLDAVCGTLPARRLTTDQRNGPTQKPGKTR
jgi:hypothetical protein